MDRSLGDVVNRISENASTLVREEIELAKTEIELKITNLARGAAVGAAAGFFVFLGLIFGFNALAWGLSDIIARALRMGRLPDRHGPCSSCWPASRG